MAELLVPQIDFSALGSLPQVYRQAQAEDLRKQTLAGLGQGGAVDAQALLKSGDMSLAQLGIGIQNRQTDNERQARQDAFQREESARAQRNADRSFGLQARAANRADEGPLEKASARAAAAEQFGIQRGTPEFKAFVLTGELPAGRAAPSGFQPGPDGASLVPLPGGPADPDYIKRINEANQKPRQMSIGDITKLSEEGGKFANLNTFGETFKPEFAGRTILGDTANIAGRNLPEAVVGKTVAEGASWWQGYDRYKNVVRNELFGSALTAPEKAAFEQADISPRMDPAQIKKNLATQKAIAENGLKRKANAMISAGYSPEAISSAYGVKIDGAGAPRASSQPSQGNGGDAILQQARDAIARGAPREAVMKRLMEAGVDGSGL
jgi:hypothetical protein